MCDDPTCTACATKEEVHKRALPLASDLATAIGAHLKANPIPNADITPLVLLRGLAMAMAGICHMAGEHKQHALVKAMNDLADVYNQLEPDESLRTHVLAGTARREDLEPEEPKITLH
jgi:hypothetical protein